MVETVFFYAFAIMAVATAVMVITGRNLFHAAMFLGAHLLVIAGYYFLLQADLVGIMQVFVYVGGVIVVLLFGIMLTSQMTDVRMVSAIGQRDFTFITVVALVGLLATMIIRTNFVTSSAAPAKDTIALAGKLFMTSYVLPFEVISILLLAALVGAVIIAREEGKRS